jgi:hypothetical protein
VHQNIRTRRPKKRPTHLTVLDGISPHDAPSRQVAVEIAPGFAPFLLLGPPQCLLNLSPSQNVDVQGFLTCATTEDAPDRQKTLVAEGMAGALAYSEIPIGPFLSTLAKIAHGYVVSQIGLDAFHALLPEFILGKNPCVSYYVGGLGPIPNIVPSSIEGDFHRVMPMTLTISGADYISVQIRLFSHLVPTPPVYLVIVGEYSGPKGSPHPVIRN